MVTTGEAEQYISEVYYLTLNGHFSSPHYKLYFTQIFLIMMSGWLKTGFVLVIAIQLLLNLVATLKIYRLANFLFQNPWLSIITALVFMLNIPYQLNNFNLATESCFYSLTIIYSAFLLQLRSLNPKNISLIFLFLILLSITRPTGILFFPATILFILTRFSFLFSRSKIFLVIVSGFIIFLFTLNGAIKTGDTLHVMMPFQQEMVICGVPGIDAPIDSSVNNSLQAIGNYVARNTSRFMELATLKTISFFGLTRPYFSARHNLSLMLLYYPWYILMLIGIIKKLRSGNPFLLYILSIIFLFWATTVITCDDWHNRFVITITPFIFLAGLYTFKKNNQIATE